MASREQNLLSEIERDLLDGKPLADLLRKCVMLGGKSGSAELRDWASKELRGYEPTDEPPKYRTIGALLMADAITGNSIVRGQRISPSALPEFARDDIQEELTLRHGVGELEALVDGRKSDEAIRISIPMAADIGGWMDRESGNPWQHINAIYWSIVPPSIHRILDNVRTSLTEIVAELAGTMPRGQDVPTADQAHQAVQVAVHGSVRRSTSQQPKRPVTEPPAAFPRPIRLRNPSLLGGHSGGRSARLWSAARSSSGPSSPFLPTTTSPLPQPSMNRKRLPGVEASQSGYAGECDPWQGLIWWAQHCLR